MLSVVKKKNSAQYVFECQVIVFEWTMLRQYPAPYRIAEYLGPNASRIIGHDGVGFFVRRVICIGYQDSCRV